MSKFGYKAEGELNASYTLELLKEYLAQTLNLNDTKGIVEDDFKIDTSANRFVRWFKDKTKRISLHGKSGLLDNYNKLLTTKYVKSIQDKLQIFVETNVLEAKQIFELYETLKAINFGVVIPEIEHNRYKVIRQSEKRFLKVLNYIKYLKHANSEYVLFNTPVADLKPFLSDKVSVHKVNYVELQKLVEQFVNLRYSELTDTNFEPYEPEFVAKCEDFYIDNITDSGIGEDVEHFIREKMLEKLKISQKDDILVEDKQADIGKIDALLKRLKVAKIEQMMQNLIKLKTNLAHAKEVMDKCKDTLNSSTIINKAGIFLIMDNLYYNLSKKCDTLQQNIKLKLQLVDKEKMFTLLSEIQNPTPNSVKVKKKVENKADKKAKTPVEPKADKQLTDNAEEPKQEKASIEHKPIASNLYDDDDEAEIDITEDDGIDNAEEEIIIDDDK